MSFDSCIFRPDGLYGKKWVGELRRDVIHKVKKGQIIGCLPLYVELDENTTLRDIMNFVRDSKFLTNFLQKYSMCGPIDEYHKELDLPPQIDENDDMCLLVISWPKQKSELCLMPDFSGAGEKAQSSYQYEGMGVYGIGFTPISKLAHLPVRLDEEMIFLNQYAFDQEISKVKASFTLLDVLNAIYYEISFVGAPEDRDQMKETLSDRLDEAIANMEDNDLEDWFEEDIEEDLPPLELDK